MATEQQQRWDDVSTVDTTRLVDPDSRPSVPAVRPAPPSVPLPRARAPRVSRLSPWERVARSIELAEAQHLVFRASYVQTSQRGERIFRVPSCHRRDPDYLVAQNLTTREWACGCMPASFGYPCAHIGAAAHLQAHIEQRMQEAGHSAELDYRATAEWLRKQGW